MKDEGGHAFGVHAKIPLAQFVDGHHFPFIIAVVERKPRRQGFGKFAAGIELHLLHVADRMPFLLVQKLFQARRSPAGIKFHTQKVGIIVADDLVVGADNFAGGWVVEAR